jgi:hypothetical protein
MRTDLLILLLSLSACMMGQEIKENILENQIYIDRMAVLNDAGYAVWKEQLQSYIY